MSLRARRAYSRTPPDGPGRGPLSLRWPPLPSLAVLQVLAAEAESLLRRHAYIVLTARWDFLAPDEATWLHALEVPVVPKPFELSRLLEVVAQAATRLRDAEP